MTAPISRYPVLVLTVVTLAADPSLSPAHAQGSLEPPGPPAPTMHSLDQVWYRLDELNAAIGPGRDIDWAALTNAAVGISDITNIFSRINWNAFTNLYAIARDYDIITNALARINWSAIMNIHTNLASDFQMLNSKVDRLSEIVSNDHANMQARLAMLEAEMAFTTNMLNQIYEKVKSLP